MDSFTDFFRGGESLKTSYILALAVVVIVVIAGLVGLWAGGMFFSTTKNITPPTNTPTLQPTNSPPPQTIWPTQVPTPQITSNPSQTPNQITTNPTPTAIPTPTATYSPAPTPAPSSTPTINIAVSYSLTTSPYYTWTGASGNQFKENADTGKTFVQITLTAQNNGYESFNTNPNYFYLTANNIRYTYDTGTYSIDTQTKWATVDVLNGGTFIGTILFEVPNTATDFSIGYDRYFTPYNIVWMRI